MENGEDSANSLANLSIVEYVGDDRFGRKIFVCSAALLPTEVQAKEIGFETLATFHESLFNEIIKSFDKYSDFDYVIVYLHRGLTSENQPTYSWLLRSYRSIDRK